MEISDVTQVPDACTLPTVERPLRVAEFDRLFAAATSAERLGPGQARIALPSDPEVAAQAADLVVRETRCCSFFTFSLTATAGRLHLDVTVPESQGSVLDAIVGRVERVRATS
jgi:hypothetical protein